MEVRQQDTVLIFDYDGTLNCSELIYVPAFLNMFETMVRDGITESRVWDPEEITCFLGCSAVEMWLEFMPDISRDLMSYYSGYLGEEMLAMIEHGQAEWYTGAEETLQTLHDRGYRMVVLSNCKKHYMDVNREAFGMDRFFERYYDCESFDFAPKTDIFRDIQRECEAKRYIIIGDRRHDLEVAKEHDLLCIGCNYGYGHAEELEDADYQIEKISDLLKILP